MRIPVGVESRFSRALIKTVQQSFRNRDSSVENFASWCDLDSENQESYRKREEIVKGERECVERRETEEREEEKEKIFKCLRE